MECGSWTAAPYTAASGAPEIASDLSAFNSVAGQLNLLLKGSDVDNRLEDYELDSVCEGACNECHNPAFDETPKSCVLVQADEATPYDVSHATILEIEEAPSEELRGSFDLDCLVGSGPPSFVNHERSQRSQQPEQCSLNDQQRIIQQCAISGPRDRKGERIEDYELVSASEGAYNEFHNPTLDEKLDEKCYTNCVVPQADWPISFDVSHATISKIQEAHSEEQRESVNVESLPGSDPKAATLPRLLGSQERSQQPEQCSLKDQQHKYEQRDISAPNDRNGGLLEDFELGGVCKGVRDDFQKLTLDETSDWKCSKSCVLAQADQLVAFDVSHAAISKIEEALSEEQRESSDEEILFGIGPNAATLPCLLASHERCQQPEQCSLNDQRRINQQHAISRPNDLNGERLDDYELDSVCEGACNECRSPTLDETIKCCVLVQANQPISCDDATISEKEKVPSEEQRESFDAESLVRNAPKVATLRTQSSLFFRCGPPRFAKHERHQQSQQRTPKEQQRKYKLHPISGPNKRKSERVEDSELDSVCEAACNECHNPTLDEKTCGKGSKTCVFAQANQRIAFDAGHATISKKEEAHTEEQCESCDAGSLVESNPKGTKLLCLLANHQRFQVPEQRSLKDQTRSFQQRASLEPIDKNDEYLEACSMDGYSDRGTQPSVKTATQSRTVPEQISVVFRGQEGTLLVRTADYGETLHVEFDSTVLKKAHGLEHTPCKSLIPRSSSERDETLKPAEGLSAIGVTDPDLLHILQILHPSTVRPSRLQDSQCPHEVDSRN